MKQKLLRAALALLVIIALLCLPPLLRHIFSQDSVSYKETFKKASSVDGAASESYAIELKELFDRKPDEFIVALNNENDEVIANVILFLIGETKTEALDSLTDCFAQYENKPQYANLLSIFNTHMESQRILREESQSIAPPETVSSYAFDPETIKGFIDLNLQLGETHDDGYNQTVANAYLADPVQFAELILAYPEKDIDIILTSVSAGLKLLNKTPPTVSQADLKADIVNIITALESKYRAD